MNAAGVDRGAEGAPGGSGTTGAETLLLASGLVLSRPGAPPLRFPDAHIARGEHWLVQGPSGCGKSSWLHLLCGLLLPSAGRLVVDGCEPARMAAAQRDRWRGRRCGLVFQQPHLLPGLSVVQNLLAARYCAGLPADRARTQQVLRALDIAQLASRPVHRLSQGQAQRVAVARAVVNQPVLILADEPTASLDDANAAAVLALLQESARAQGAALIVVTHDQRLRSAFARRLDFGGRA